MCIDDFVQFIQCQASVLIFLLHPVSLSVEYFSFGVLTFPKQRPVFQFLAFPKCFELEGSTKQGFFTIS